ncbi:anaerobic ribonucleoside-triphosphate reductase activating protein [Roseateles sp. DAIF2]|uniref:anaerobic ribonucleoside-triphosphate reductase activating protein n=1 Tax=Roseateles sp. DAIF2 TaxID=2714952 RepID=UPI0018A2A7E5|nr:anaerobic ribonucleoside-triphosphate reductase activating protein [Roseateles sp. DAIF2]QPF74019.1 anaerobic ribonucleoside-triphosphate reductase activating protein [Roseateles sp. DAIF2]
MPLRIGGLQPLSTIDMPGRLAAVVFLQGCPWRCGYCHNPGLQPAETPPGATPAPDWAAVLRFLEQRRGLLDGVVFSGGEPTLQQDLPAAAAQVRALGFQVGLHTAGMYPLRLVGLLPLLDWVGLDIKAPWPRLDALSGAPGSAAKLRASLGHLLRSRVAHECRTTWHPELFPAEELEALASELSGLGVRDWALQRRDGVHPPELDAAMLQRLAAGFRRFHLR